MLYKLLRTLLFQLDPERAHQLALTGLTALNKAGLSSLLYPPVKAAAHSVMGLSFPNRVGLAAGLDKNGDYIEALAALGFGFVEIGTVTPRPQAGNPQPRLFRLPEAQALINRMGFNNRGVAHLIEQVKLAKTESIIGINIGKNADTPVDHAIDDYLLGLDQVYNYADYITINISSPNTPGLRTLQFGDALNMLLAAIKEKQSQLQQRHAHYVPIAIKIAPDLDDSEISQLAAAFSQFEIDAIIVSNTTLARDAVKDLQHSDEAGGLSGAPLFAQSTKLIQQFSQALATPIPIIAAGGILSADDALAKLAAGAELVQIYSGLIYQGPQLINDIISAEAR